MNIKHILLTPIAIASMAACYSVSAQVVDIFQATPIISQPDTPISVEDFASLIVNGDPAITVNNNVPINIGFVSAVSSDQIGIDIQSDFSSAIINNGFIIGADLPFITTGTAIQIEDGTNFTGNITNLSNSNIGGVSNGINVGNGDHSGGNIFNQGFIFSDNHALNLGGTGLNVTNEIGATILTIGPFEEELGDGQGVVNIRSDTQNLSFVNQGIVDPVSSIGAAFVSQLSPEGNDFTIINTETGFIQGRGEMASDSVFAGDAIRLENLRINGELDPSSSGTFVGAIENNGLITSDSQTGQTAAFRTVDNVNFQGVLFNSNSGVIQGAQNGIYIGNGDHSGSLISNEGVISSDSRAFNIDGTGLTLNNDGEILGTGNQRNGTVYSDGTATNFVINNTGTIDAGVGNEGSGFAAEIGDDGNTFTLNNAGTIQGRGIIDATDGVRVGNPEDIGIATIAITNSGIINSESTTGTTAGLRFVNGISFDGTIDNSGTISGSQNGVYFGNAINGEGADHSNGVFNNEIDGVISSDSRAFNIDGTGLTLNNDGEILGTGNQRNGTIYVDGTATDFIVNNSITGVVDGGAGNESSALSIQVGSNSGDVQSAMIVNEGVLQGRGTGLSAGLRLFNGATDGTSTFSGNISNSGDILAEDTAAILVQSGVIFDGSIDNSGTISSTSGTAVDFSQNDTGITLNLTAGEVDGDILLGTGGDEVNITGGELTSDITGQGSGVVNINLGAGSVFTANAINNVEDYNILSGTVNQVGDFSTAGTTTTIAEGATLAFDSVINGAGALVSNGTLSFSPDSLLIQDGDVTLNEASAIEYLFDDILALDIGEQIELINATSITDNGFIVVDNNLFRDLQAIITDQGDLVIEAIAPNFDTDVNNNTQSFILALGTAIGANGLIGQNVSTTLLDASLDEVTSLAPSISGAATLGAYHLNDSVLALIKDNYASGNTNSENRNGLWVQVLGGSSSQDSETIIPGFNSNYDGVGVGYNFQIGNFQIGSSYIYTEANIDNDQSLQSSTVIENDQVVLSGDYQTGSWFLGGSLSIANLDYSFTRATSFGAASANTVGELFDASLSIGYELSSSSATNIAPFASIAYSSLEIDSFNESGGLGINNINYDDVDRLRSELGVIVRVDGSLGNWAVKPNLKFSWKYDFEDENTAFSADIDGAAFNQIGNELDTNILHIGAGILFANKNGWHFRVDFQGDFSENENNQTGSASIEYRF